MTARKITSPTDKKLDAGAAPLFDRLGRPVKHGMWNSPEYRTWIGMRGRCYNPKSQRYDRYGGRGIKVCERWQNSFMDFFRDMGPRPSAGHSIDRRDNDGHYSCGRCEECRREDWPMNGRWATRAEQNRNKSDINLIEYGGKTLSLTEWAHEIGMNVKTLERRLKSGWTVEDALGRITEPRTWNGVKSKQAGTIEWKRPSRRKATPLDISLLKTVVDAGWVRQIRVEGADPFEKHRSIKRLIILEMIESRPTDQRLSGKPYEYRITDRGRAELAEKKRQDERDVRERRHYWGD